MVMSILKESEAKELSIVHNNTLEVILTWTPLGRHARHEVSETSDLVRPSVGVTSVLPSMDVNVGRLEVVSWYLILHSNTPS